MSDLLYLLVLIGAVPVTVIWGWTGWFLLLGTGELAFSLAHPDRQTLIILGGLLSMALCIEWMIKRARDRQGIPEGLIKRVIISGGTQLALGSLFHHLVAVAVWWFGLGRFLWEQPDDERESEIKSAMYWGRLLLVRMVGALMTAIIILWLK